jgi:hypothetical protein
MIEIFILQFLAAALGAASAALADWLYVRTRIRRNLHSFWVSVSIAAISVPVLVWICSVFLGSGLLSSSLAGAVVCAIFFWVYLGLQKLPAAENLGPGLLPRHPSNGAAPPATKLNS